MAQTILDRIPPGADARISYGPHALRFADLRLPKGSGPHPCIVAIHGGFWRNRYSLDHLGHLCAALTGLGFATWNIEYRRVGDAGGGWPGTFHDVAAGAAYLFHHAPKLGIDPARVAILGHSAGGHLALWLATRPGLPGDAPGAAPAVAVAAAVSQAGVADLRASEEAGLGGGAAAALLGGSPTAVPERYDLGSPIERLPTGVPTLCVHGRGDRIVPIAQSEAWVAASTAAGDEAELVTFAGGHFEVLDPGHESWQAVVEKMLT